MRYLGIKCCERGKKYYCDKHEEQINIEYRKIYKKYFQYEKNTYRWIHLKKSNSINFEINEGDELSENTFKEFVQNNEKIVREYHVDTHPTFMTDKYKKIVNQ